MRLEAIKKSIGNDDEFKDSNEPIPTPKKEFTP